jgi:predicted transcriptional regulator
LNSETLGMGESHIKLVGELVSAYIANNRVAPTDLPGLIASVHTAISALASGGRVGASTSEPQIEKPTPAKIRKSITHDALTSFIDGKRYSTLKRHLTKHGLDPNTYRAQYGLPPDYPMVAPAYSERRSAMARNIGLGSRGSRNAHVEPPAAPKPVPRARRKSSKGQNVPRA